MFFQKLNVFSCLFQDEKDSEIEDERKKGTPSPTLEEMKADFENILPSVEDVKSGKVQLSTS